MGTRSIIKSTLVALTKIDVRRMAKSQKFCLVVALYVHERYPGRQVPSRQFENLGVMTLQ